MLKEQTREELIASLKNWKNFLEPLEPEMRKLLWKEVIKNPLYQGLLK